MCGSCDIPPAVSNESPSNGANGHTDGVNGEAPQAPQAQAAHPKPTVRGPRMIASSDPRL